MTTLVIGRNTAISIPRERTEVRVPRERKNYLGEVVNKVKNTFAIVASAFEPYFGPARLDYLDGSANLSAKEMAAINADLNGVMTN